MLAGLLTLVICMILMPHPVIYLYLRIRFGKREARGFMADAGIWPDEDGVKKRDS